MNMCQQGRKYHTSLATSAADGLFAYCERALKVHVCEYEIGRRACLLSYAHVNDCTSVVFVCILLRQLADLGCRDHARTCAHTHSPTVPM